MLKKIIALALALAISTSASASDSFQYWSYWIGTETGWQAASQGAGTTLTKDQMVQGWRFVETGVGLTIDQAPSSGTKFLDLCPTLSKPKQGFDRVALVIDYGTVQSAQTPPSPQTDIHCLSVTTGTRSIELLAKVTNVREEAGFICALSNYPKTGCGEAISETNNSDSSGNEETSTIRLIYGVVSLLGIAIFLSLRFQKRRSRK